MTIEELDAFILQKMAETRLPGLSLAILDGREVAYAQAFGFRDLERGLRSTPSTLYAVASLTKSITCLAIMQLQERGALRLDDPVETYLPLSIRPFGEPIRVHHLMSHTSGIPCLGYADAVISYALGVGGRWLPLSGGADMLTFLDGAADWIQARPGERYFYLNEGYALLGGIIERVSGQPYADYVQERILLPLGMDHSFFRRAEVEARPDAAVPYMVTPTGRVVPGRYPFGQMDSMGGLVSSARDMSRFLRLWVGDDTADVISRASLREMTTPRVDVAEEEIPEGKGPGVAGMLPTVGSYGYGLRIQRDFFGHTLVGHGGDIGAGTAYLGFIPERRLGVILLSNGNGYPMGHLGAVALAAMLGKDPALLPFLRVEQALERLTGAYESYRGTTRARITRQGDFLCFEAEDRFPRQHVTLVPLSLDGLHPRFFTLSEGRRLVVEFGRHEGTGDVELLYERYKYRRVGPVPVV